MRIKAKTKDGITLVRYMAKHISLSETEAKKRGKVGNYITYVVAKNNDKIVFEANMSQSVSTNPYIKFAYKDGKKGDTLSITWTDLLGKTKTGTAKIK